MGELDIFKNTQMELCKKFAADFTPPEAETTLGFAIRSEGKTPVYGIRHPAAGKTNGWYIWCGDKSDAPDFFQALHTEHLVNRCPAAIRFLALPPGYGFVVDGDYVDVWFDSSFLVS